MSKSIEARERIERGVENVRRFVGRDEAGLGMVRFIAIPAAGLAAWALAGSGALFVAKPTMEGLLSAQTNASGASSDQEGPSQANGAESGVATGVEKTPLVGGVTAEKPTGKGGVVQSPARMGGAGNGGDGGAVGEGCGSAEQLGPWAPSADGQGETYEVSVARAGTLLSMWWLHGRTPWGQKEVIAVLGTGTSIDVLNGGGTAWDYPEGCSTEEIERQAAVYVGVRPNWTNFHGRVELDELRRLGLVRDRQVRKAAAATTAPSASKAEPKTGAAECPPGTQKVQEGFGDATFTGPAIISRWWQGHDDVDGGTEARLFVKEGEKVTLIGGAGSWWEFASGCSEEDLKKQHEDNAEKGGFRIVTTDQLKAAGLAR